MEKPKRRKVSRYLPALLWNLQMRGRGGRGVVVSVKTRDICGKDKRCAHALRHIMMGLVEMGLARRHKQGVYLIEREALEKAITTLREWI